MDYDDEALRLICDSQDTIHQLEKLTVANDSDPELVGTSNVTNIGTMVHDHVCVGTCVKVVNIICDPP